MAEILGLAHGANERRRDGGNADMVMPSREEIASMRHVAGLTQAQAAALVHRKKLAWLRWEAGHPVDMACWELFLIKTKNVRKKNSSA